jgi:hypothetical protein
LGQLHVFSRAPPEVLPKLWFSTSSWSSEKITHQCHLLHKKTIRLFLRSRYSLPRAAASRAAPSHRVATRCVATSLAASSCSFTEEADNNTSPIQSTRRPVRRRRWKRLARRLAAPWLRVAGPADRRGGRGELRRRPSPARRATGLPSKPRHGAPGWQSCAAAMVVIPNLLGRTSDQAARRRRGASAVGCRCSRSSHCPALGNRPHRPLSHPHARQPARPCRPLRPCARGYRPRRPLPHPRTQRSGLPAIYGRCWLLLRR